TAKVTSETESADRAEGEEGEIRQESWWRKKKKDFDRVNRRMRRACRKAVKSQAFYWLIILLVFFNTVVLATEHYGQPDWLDEFQVSKGYFVSLFNRFDCFVVIGSIGEIILTKTDVFPPLGVSVLRCVRLLRVFKVTKYWRSLSNLVASLLNSIQSIASLLLLLFLFIVIFALLGMQVFGGKFDFEDTSDKIRSNFDSFWQSLLTVFQSDTVAQSVACLSTELRAPDILLNVFLAIAVDNLADAESLTAIEKEEEEEAEKQHNSHSGSPAREDGETEGTGGGTDGDDGDLEQKTDENEISEKDEETASHTKVRLEIGDSEEYGYDEQTDNQDDYFEENEDGNEPKSARPRRLSEISIKNTIQPVPEGSSFFIFSNTNRFRVFCHWFCNHSYFGNLILASIMISSAMLAAEDPLNSTGGRND
ncbi:unnamed protein product, partial [Timema podura]|nr:unnamed protein product [Timema podura]